MSGLPMMARWTAVMIAIAAVWDPSVRFPHSERPTVGVTHLRRDAQESDRGQTGVRQESDKGQTGVKQGSDRGQTPDAAARLTRALRDAGFAVNVPVDPDDRDVATVLISDRLPAVTPRNTPIWALDTTPPSPNVRIVHAVGPRVRLPEQALEISVDVDASGVVGQTSELMLEDSGITVATLRHAWRDRERWNASFQYLPPGMAAGRLRVRAVPLASESTTADNVADVAVPPARGPIRTLVAEIGVTWPAMFTRRALEGEPAFAISAVQRAAKKVATRAGAPPATISREALAPFEAVIVGGPDNLTAADIAALRWFVEERGATAVLIPDQRPVGRYVELLGDAAFEPRMLDQPARLGGEGGLVASELLIGRRLPLDAHVLATTTSGEAVIFSARRGAGAVVFSGALDAWRHRDQAFAGFWRRVILEEASAAPPVLDVAVDPPIVTPGETTHITARVRGSELPAANRIDLDAIAARAVSAQGQGDVAVRLWPTAEPGAYEGSWQPSAAGDYDIAVTIGDLRGDARLTADADVAHGSAADPDGLALAASTSGGRVFPADHVTLLVDAMSSAYPARRVTRPTLPMRSPWWAIPFAGLLCAEWAIRRKHGQP
jgi:hypothetical protein